MSDARSALLSAVSWSGSDVTLSMFVVVAQVTAPSLPDLGGHAGRYQLRTYEMEDTLGVLRGQHVYEYDLVWSDIPPELDRIVRDCLRSALQHGATVAWFAFEGSFDLEYVLHPDVASQVYAVAAGDSVELALGDDYRSSEDWRRLLAQLRLHVLP